MTGPAASLVASALTFTYYSGSTSTGASLAGAPTTVGTYTVVANFAGTVDFDSATSTTTFSITRASPNISLTDAGGTFNGSSYPASASISGVGAGAAFAASLEGVSLALAYYSGLSPSGTSTSAAPTSAGTYTVVASFPGSTDYSSASPSTTFAITRATPTLSVTDNGGTFNGSGFAASASLTGVSGGPTASLEGNAPTFTYYSGSNSAGPNLGSSAPSTSGIYTVVANFASTTDYASTNASTTYSITQATPTVTVTDAGGPVNGSPYPASAAVAGVSGPPSATLEGSGLSLIYYSGSNSAGPNLGSSAPSALGTYTVVASFPGSTDYSSSSAQTTFSIFDSKLVLSQETQITAGSPFILTVTVETLTGQIETTFNGSITVTLVNNPGNVSFGPLTETAEGGQATFSNQILTKAGVSYQLQAQATVNTALITAVTQPFAVSPSSPSVFTSPILAPAAGTDAAGNSLTYTVQAGEYSQIFAIEEQFGLEPVVQPITVYQLTNSDFNFNAHGGDELNLVSETGGNLANGGAYFIVPNGNLYAYDGNSLHSSETTGFIASLGASVYNQPELLYDPSSVPYMPLASTVEGNLDLQQPPETSTYFFNTRGLDEKYLRSGNNKNSAEAGYYIIVPNGNLYTWTNNDLTDTLATTPVATLPVSYYENPDMLTTPTPQGSLSTLTASVSGGKLMVTDTAFQGTAIIYLSTADGTQTFDATFTDTAPVVTLPAVISNASHLSVDDIHLTSPDAAENPVTYSATVGGYNSLFDIEQQFALTAPNPNGPGSEYLTDTRGAGEKYLVSINGSNSGSLSGGYFVLVPEPNSASPTFANLYAWTDNSLTDSEAGTPISVPLSAYNDPTQIINAQAPYNPAAFNASTLDLQAPPNSNYFYNARGYGEKYFVSGNGNNASEAGYYIMTPNGNLYAWTNNSISDTLASTLSPPDCRRTTIKIQPCSSTPCLRARRPE